MVASGDVSPREAWPSPRRLRAGRGAAAAASAPGRDGACLLVAAAVAATYPLAKRFFPMPQLYLSVAFSFGIPMAFAGVLGHVPRVGWRLFIANMFWVVAYDTEYAMVDRDDDISLGIRSSAVFFGRADVAAVMGCYGGCSSPSCCWSATASTRLAVLRRLGLAVLSVLYHYG